MPVIINDLWFRTVDDSDEIEADWGIKYQLLTIEEAQVILQNLSEEIEKARRNRESR